MIFIEFSKVSSVEKGLKFVMPVVEITSIEETVDENTIINGIQVEQKYEDVLDLLDRYDSIIVERELTGMEEKKEASSGVD